MRMLLNLNFAQVLFASDALIHRLDVTQRVRLLAAFGVILTLGALLILFIRSAARTARWYGRDVGRRPQWTPRSIASQDGMPRSTNRPDT